MSVAEHSRANRASHALGVVGRKSEPSSALTTRRGARKRLGVTLPWRKTWDLRIENRRQFLEISNDVAAAGTDFYRDDQLQQKARVIT
jgi:hypothetical protein